MRQLRHFLSVYYNVLLFTLKSALEYRLNFIMQIFYGPAYTVVLYFVLQTIYSKTPTLGGWTAQEGMLLFSIFHILYMTFYFFFMKGLRYMLWSGIRMGELDFVLIKPINAQFYLSIAKPNIEQLPLLAILSSYCIYLLTHNDFHITVLSSLLFAISAVVGIAIVYFSLSSYVTIGFYAAKSAQIIELFDKAADFSQYPVTIFPSSIQLIAFSLIPIAYFSYLPTSFLLGKGTTLEFAGMLVTLAVLVVLNRWLWKRGLEHYSSASS